MDYMAALEEKIEQMVARLEAVREENSELREKVRALEKENAELSERPIPEPPAEFLLWQEEKAEIRRRIEAVIAKLEPLVGE